MNTRSCRKGQPLAHCNLRLLMSEDISFEISKARTPTAMVLGASGHLTKHCIFFSKLAGCKNGKSCRFIHDPEQLFVKGGVDEIAKSRGSNPRELEVSEAKGGELCVHFARGRCRAGDHCKYVHDTNLPDVEYSRNDLIASGQKDCDNKRGHQSQKRKRDLSGVDAETLLSKYSMRKHVKSLGECSMSGKPLGE